MGEWLCGHGPSIELRGGLSVKEQGQTISTSCPVQDAAPWLWGPRVPWLLSGWWQNACPRQGLLSGWPLSLLFLHFIFTPVSFRDQFQLTLACAL